MQKAVDDQLALTVRKIQAKQGKPNWKGFVLKELIELFSDLEGKLFVQDEKGNVVKNKRGNPKVSPWKVMRYIGLIVARVAAAIALAKQA